MYSENLGVYSENLGVYFENLGVYSGNLRVYSENLGVQSENLGVYSENLRGYFSNGLLKLATGPVQVRHRTPMLAPAPAAAEKALATDSNPASRNVSNHQALSSGSNPAAINLSSAYFASVTKISSSYGAAIRDFIDRAQRPCKQEGSNTRSRVHLEDSRTPFRTLERPVLPPINHRILRGVCASHKRHQYSRRGRGQPPSI